jgi:hypothetical protein
LDGSALNVAALVKNSGMLPTLRMKMLFRIAWLSSK